MTDFYALFDAKTWAELMDYIVINDDAETLESLFWHISSTSPDNELPNHLRMPPHICSDVNRNANDYLTCFEVCGTSQFPDDLNDRLIHCNAQKCIAVLNEYVH